MVLSSSVHVILLLLTWISVAAGVAVSGRIETSALLPSRDLLPVDTWVELVGGKGAADIQYSLVDQAGKFSLYAKDGMRATECYFSIAIMSRKEATQFKY